MITVQNSVPNPVVEEAVLFPFDSYSCPFSAGLRLQLIPGKIPGRANPIVVGAGEPGAADDFCTRFYGTVIPIDGELRMWYLARSTLDADGSNGGQLRCCYATSTDGLHWDKPDLGLIEFNGSTHNNIVNLRAGRCDFAALPVMYEPDDPDPSRRFKCVFESEAYGNQFAVAYSADGLNWTESESPGAGRQPGRPGRLALPGLDQTGLIRHNGCYYVNGQGNVILGIYDIWHGTSDRQLISMDLGFLVSHDALHFEEPIKDFPILPAYEETGAVVGKPPTVSHGQGMVNWGDQTLMWYEAWGNLPVEVRLATWERDRIGYFEAMGGDGGHWCLPAGRRHRVQRQRGGLGPLHGAAFRAARGLPSAARLQRRRRRRAHRAGGSRRRRGGSGAGAGPAGCRAGRRTARDPLAAPRAGRRWRGLQVSFAGVRPEDARLYAIYAR